MELVLLLLVVLVVAAALLASRFMQHGNPFPVSRKATLFTQVERNFMLLLEQAVNGEYKIMNRVKMLDLLDFKQNTDSKSRRAAMLKMNAKYLDFVLCDPKDMTIVAVIDLVNNNSKDGHKAAPDWFVSGALEAAGLPYIRMKVRTDYSLADIQAGLAAKIGKNLPKPDPLLKGHVKKGPTRPVRPLTPVLSPNQIKAQSTALIH
ncbi:DUF2726 domain-containing protein [Rheinheimera marina]|uniref:DUF2726 domain-containing protein n=1 Tax=Rheinheimera marina TaxID=1774958 RepID=A0ABV9JKZ5_9GAMM